MKPILILLAGALLALSLSGCVVYRRPLCPPGYHLGPRGVRCWSNF